jgi:hypothetical protein
MDALLEDLMGNKEQVSVVNFFIYFFILLLYHCA